MKMKLNPNYWVQPALTPKCSCYILVQLDPDIGVEPVNTMFLGQFKGQTQISGI